MMLVWIVLALVVIGYSALGVLIWLDERSPDWTPPGDGSYDDELNERLYDEELHDWLSGDDYGPID